jgi:putative sigma-54 modulation protein
MSDEPDRSAGPVIVRERLEVKPQFEEEAIAEMDASGLTFYVFLNARNENVNVAYRHNDGTYGVIEPQAG